MPIKKYYQETEHRFPIASVALAPINTLLFLYFEQPIPAIISALLLIGLGIFMSRTHRVLTNATTTYFHDLAPKGFYNQDTQATIEKTSDRLRKKIIADAERGAFHIQDLGGVAREHAEELRTTRRQALAKQTYTQQRDPTTFFDYRSKRVHQIIGLSSKIVPILILASIYKYPNTIPYICLLLSLLPAFGRDHGGYPSGDKTAAGIQAEADQLRQMNALVAVVITKPDGGQSAVANATAEEAVWPSQVFIPTYVLNELGLGIAAPQQRLQSPHQTGAKDNQRSNRRRSRFAAANAASACKSSQSIELPSSATGCIIRDSHGGDSMIYVEFPDKADQDQDVRDTIDEIREGRYSFCAKKGGNGFKRQDNSYKFKLFSAPRRNPRWPMKQQESSILANVNGKPHSIPRYLVTEYGIKR